MGALKTFTREYDEINWETGEYETKTGEFAKVSEIEKRDHKKVYFRKAVDYCIPSLYLVDGIIWREETAWKNTMLRGCGSARNTGKTFEEYCGEDSDWYIHNPK